MLARSRNGCTTLTVGDAFSVGIGDALTRRRFPENGAPSSSRSAAAAYAGLVIVT